MHHDYLIIASHIGAELGPLTRSMNASADITLNRTPFIYSTPQDLQQYLKAVCEKYQRSRIYADFACYNYSLRSAALYKVCRFVYYLGEPRRTLTALIRKYNYLPEKAYNYYAFRLQRLAFMAKSTPDAMLLTWNELHSPETEKSLKQFLRLKSQLYLSIEGEDLQHPPAEGSLADKAEKVYVKYLEQLKKYLPGDSNEITVSEGGRRSLGCEKPQR